MDVEKEAPIASLSIKFSAIVRTSLISTSQMSRSRVRSQTTLELTSGVITFLLCIRVALAFNFKCICQKESARSD